MVRYDEDSGVIKMIPLPVNAKIATKCIINSHLHYDVVDYI